MQGLRPRTIPRRGTVCFSKWWVMGQRSSMWPEVSIAVHQWSKTTMQRGVNSCTGCWFLSTPTMPSYNGSIKQSFWCNLKNPKCQNQHWICTVWIFLFSYSWIFYMHILSSFNINDTNINLFACRIWLECTRGEFKQPPKSFVLVSYQRTYEIDSNTTCVI